ncbi:MAG: protein kinase [Azonexus sp.]
MPSKLPDLPQDAINVLAMFPEFELAIFNDTGANGYVLIGRHAVLKKDVAIKIYFHAPNDVDQEPSIISQINHENVLKVYDARRLDSDSSYFLMPAASDGDLSNYLSNYYLPIPLAHKLLCQLLSGVAALHAKPNLLVHRDLKPENLLVHDDVVVIADFGSVRRIDQKTLKAPASKHSILYRPLEAFGEAAFFDFSSDIYQVGIIGFLLFGGKISNVLTDHMTEKEKAILATLKDRFEQSIYIDSCIESRIRSGRLIDWDSLPVFVPNTIRKILKLATSTFDKRYKNVSDFLAALSKARAGLPDWIINKDGYLLRDWKGNDYFLPEGENIVLKRKAGKKDFRTDKQYSGNCVADIFMQLRANIVLP